MIIATKIKTPVLKPDFSIEDEVFNNEFQDLKSDFFIVGIDEAGRGPLCGPVVAAAVILDQNNYPEELNDSKKLSSKKRREIFNQLKNTSKYGVGVVDEQIIDEINILNATKLAMKMAFDDLSIKYNITANFALIDGNFIPQINCSAQAIVKGDQKSLSISAASIIAKEIRDEIMFKLDQEFPEYEWSKNKGYATAKHYDMIKKFGISKYHRQSFKLIKKENN